MVVTGRAGVEVDAVVLAGQANQGPFSDEYTVPNEALIPAGGHPLLTWVLAALGQSSRVRETIVVGPPRDLEVALGPIQGEAAARIRIVEPGESITDNIRIGVDAAGSGRWILVSTADIPLITGEIVDEFIASGLETGADFCYPIATRERVEELYPGAERTYVRIAGQTYTGGNLFLVHPDAVEPALEVVDRFFRHRKNPIRLAGLLGPGFILRFVAGRLRLPDLERKVSDMLRLDGRVIVTDHPEIGLDVDKPSHLPLIDAALSGKAPGR